MFIDFRELTSASCQSMAHTPIYVNLYTRIRAVVPRVTSCIMLLDTLLEHLIISKPLDGLDLYRIMGYFRVAKFSRFCLKNKEIIFRGF